MKARFRGIEFEVEDEKDLNLILSLTDERRKEMQSEIEVGREAKTEKRGWRKRSEIVAEAVEISKSGNMNFKQAMESLGIVNVKGTDYKLAGTLGYKKSRGYKNKRKPKFKKRVSRKFQRWTPEEDEIVLKYPVRKARTMLAGRTRMAIYTRLYTLQRGKVRNLRFKYEEGKETQVKDKKKWGWSDKEDKILKTCRTVSEAAKFLPGRSKASIYTRRGLFGLSKRQRAPAETRQIKAKMELVEEDNLSFDIFKKDPEEKDKTQILLDVIKHSDTAKRKLAVRDLVSVFQITIGEAKALIMDIFQQQSRISKRLNVGKMVLSNPSDPILSFE
jgi:hypothetical protein